MNDVLVSTSIGVDLTIADIGVGKDCTIFLASNGTVFGVGKNDKGQLGQGDVDPRLDLVMIGDFVASDIWVGMDHLFIKLINGSFVCLGSNSAGKLGLGDTVDRLYATINDGLVETRTISSSYHHTLSLLNNGTLLVFGNNSFGQLGTGDQIDQTRPVLLDLNITKIATGRFHSLVLDSNGNLWGFGLGTDGQLGLGVGINVVLVPTFIVTDIVQFSAGEYHSVMLHMNNSVYVTGVNSFGQLGLNDTNNRMSLTHSVSKVSLIGTSESQTFFLQNTTCNDRYSSDSNVCNGQGVCTTQLICECKSNYTGDNCQVPICGGRPSNDPLACRGVGMCTAPDYCDCNGFECQFGEFHWNAVSGSWSNSSNWLYRLNGMLVDGRRSPTQGDVAIFDFDGVFEAFMDVSLNLTYLQVGSGNSRGVLTINETVNLDEFVLNSGSRLDVAPAANLTLNANQINGNIDVRHGSNVIFLEEATLNGTISAEVGAKVFFKKAATIKGSSVVDPVLYTFDSQLTMGGNSLLNISTSYLYKFNLTISDSASLSIPQNSDLATNGNVHIDTIGMLSGVGIWNMHGPVNLFSNSNNISFTLNVSSDFLIHGNNNVFVGSVNLNPLSKLYIAQQSFIENTFQVQTPYLTGVGSLKVLTTGILVLSTNITIPYAIDSLGKIEIHGDCIFKRSFLSSGVVFIANKLVLENHVSILTQSNRVFGNGSLVTTDGSDLILTGGSTISVQIQASGNISLISGSFVFALPFEIRNESSVDFQGMTSAQYLSTFLFSSSGMIRGIGSITFDDDAHFVSPMAVIEVELNVKRAIFFDGHFHLRNTVNTAWSVSVETGSFVYFEGNTTISPSPLIGNGTVVVANTGSLSFLGGLNTSFSITSYAKIIFSGDSTIHGAVSLVNGSFIDVNSVVTFSSLLHINSDNNNVVRGSGRMVIGQNGTLLIAAPLSTTISTQVQTAGINVIESGVATFEKDVMFAITSTLNVSSSATIEFLQKSDFYSNSPIVGGEGSLINTKTGNMAFWGSGKTIFLVKFISKSNVTFNSGEYGFNRQTQFTNAVIQVKSPAILSFDSSISLNNTIWEGNGEMKCSEKSIVDWTGGSITNINLNIDSFISFAQGTYLFNGNSSLTPLSRLQVNAGAFVEFTGPTNFQTNPSQISGGGVIKLARSSTLVLSGVVTNINVTFNAFSNVTFLAGEFVFFKSATFGPNTQVELRGNSSIRFESSLDIFQTDFIGTGSMIIGDGAVVNWNGGNTVIDVEYASRGSVNFLSGAYQFNKNSTFEANSQSVVSASSTLQFASGFTTTSSVYSGEGLIHLKEGGFGDFSSSTLMNTRFASEAAMKFGVGSYDFGNTVLINPTASMSLSGSEVRMRNQTTWNSAPLSLSGYGSLIMEPSSIVTFVGTNLTIPYSVILSGSASFDGNYVFIQPMNVSATSILIVSDISSLEFQNTVQFSTSQNSIRGNGLISLTESAHAYFDGVGRITTRWISLGNITLRSGSQFFDLPVELDGVGSLQLSSDAKAGFNSNVTFKSRGLLYGGGIFEIANSGGLIFNTPSLSIDVSLISNATSQFLSGSYKLTRPSSFNQQSTLFIESTSVVEINSVVDILSLEETLDGSGLIRNGVNGVLNWGNGVTQVNTRLESISTMNFLSGRYSFNQNVSIVSANTTINPSATVIFNSNVNQDSNNYLGGGNLIFSNNSDVFWNSGALISVGVASDAKITYQDGNYAFTQSLSLSRISSTLITTLATLRLSGVNQIDTTSSNFGGNGTFITDIGSTTTFTGSYLAVYLKIVSRGSTRWMSGTYDFFIPAQFESSSIIVDPATSWNILTSLSYHNVPSMTGQGTITLPYPQTWNLTTTTTTNMQITLNSNSMMNFEGLFVFSTNPVQFGSLSETFVKLASQVTFDSSLTIQTNEKTFYGGGSVVFGPNGLTNVNGLGTVFETILQVQSQTNFVTGNYNFARPITVDATGKINVAQSVSLQFDASATIFASTNCMTGSGSLILPVSGSLIWRDGITVVTPTIRSSSVSTFIASTISFRSSVEILSTGRNIINIGSSMIILDTLQVSTTTGNAFSGAGNLLVQGTVNHVTGNVQGVSTVISPTGVYNLIRRSLGFVVFDSSKLEIQGVWNYETSVVNLRRTNLTIALGGVMNQVFGSVINNYSPPGDVLKFDASTDTSLLKNFGVMNLYTTNETELLIDIPVINSGSINIRGDGNVTLNERFAQTAFALLNVENSYVKVPGTMVLTDGILRVSGTIETNSLNMSSNTGIMRINTPGALKVIGNLNLFTSATLVVTINGLTRGNHDEIEVTGILHMQCFLYVKLGPDYLPVVGDQLTFIFYTQGSITSLVNMIGASYRNSRIIPDEKSANLQVITSIGSVGNLNYTCHYLGKRKIIEFNRFDLTNSISVTITGPVSDNWVGFGFGPNRNFTDSLQVVSTNNQSFQIYQQKKYLGLFDLDTFLDIGSNEINTLFDIGPLYKSMSVFLPLNWFDQQNSIYYYEFNQTGPIMPGDVPPEPTYVEVYDFKLVKDPNVACTNFIAPQRAEIYSPAATGSMLGFYLVLFILCLALCTQQPLASRGVSPYFTLFFMFAVLILEIRSYFYITDTQQTLCLFNAYAVYPLMQLCYIMIFVYNIRYFAIINLNVRKNDLSVFITDDAVMKEVKAKMNKKGDIATKFLRLGKCSIITLKLLGTWWFPALLMFGYTFVMLLIFTIIQAGYSFECKFETLVALKLTNTIVLILISFSIICLIIGDIVNNWRVLFTKCGLWSFTFTMDPYYFRAQMLMFLPFMLYTLVFEIWSFFSTFTFKQIVDTHPQHLILNTIAFAILLILDVLFPLGITILWTLRKLYYRTRPNQTISVYEMFANPDLEKILVSFSQTEYSVENALAYRDILSYRRYRSKETAMKIWQDYLCGNDAIMELNLPAKVAKEVKLNLDKELFTDDLFNTVEACITLNLSDTLSRIIYYPDYIIYNNNKHVKQSMLETLGI